MKGKKAICQSTFDAVVKENVDEFQMDPSEAIADAVKQFEAQNVDLSNVVTSLPADSGPSSEILVSPSEKASQLVSSLKTIVETDPITLSDLLRVLADVKAECDVDLPRRCLVGNNGAAGLLLEVVKKFESDFDVLGKTLGALIALTNGQPDVITEGNVAYLCLKVKENEDNAPLVCQFLKLLHNSCVKHEGNRLASVDNGIIEIIMKALQQHKTVADLVKICCSTLRVLSSDDDMRVAFGRAHEHAKMMVTDHGAIKVLLGLTKGTEYDSTVTAELFATLSSLAVRNEFCQEVVDEGGLLFLIKTVMENIGNQAMVRNSLSLLRSIAGNDAVKKEIANASGIELVLTAMNKHQTEAKVCDAGSACLAALALRCPTNCQLIIDGGGVDVLTTVMKIHKDDASLQKNSCRAIRNLVSRTRQFNKDFLEAGAEGLINEARKRHQQVEDDAKAALRDLGCKIVLVELWTGKKGELNN